VFNLFLFSVLCASQTFQRELTKRTSNIAMVRKAAKDLMDTSDEDTTLLQEQLIDLTTKWDKICLLSVDKQQRLTDALTQVTIATNNNNIIIIIILINNNNKFHLILLHDNRT